MFSPTSLRGKHFPKFCCCVDISQAALKIFSNYYLIKTVKEIHPDDESKTSLKYSSKNNMDSWWDKHFVQSAFNSIGTIERSQQADLVLTFLVDLGCRNCPINNAVRDNFKALLWKVSIACKPCRLVPCGSIELLTVRSLHRCTPARSYLFNNNVWTSI